MVDHLQIELISALMDGELEGSTERKARAHLAECAECAEQLASLEHLDHALTAPVVIQCAGSAELRSALLDSELSASEAAVASAHLTACRACRSTQATWASIEVAMRGLPPARPPVALDARIARLTAPDTRPGLPLGTLPGRLGIPGVGVAVMILATVVGLLPAIPGDPQRSAESPAAERAIVAGVQQFVLYAPTNTLYVLQPQAGAVDAVDGASHALRTRIHVGGRPTALALNESASRIVVLDAGQRSVVEIDAREDRVVSTTSLPLSGRPTSVAVDQTTGRIIVAAIPDPPSVDGPAATPTLGARPNAGSVAVLDPATRRLETFNSVEVAPQLVVPDVDGKLALLVSSGATTLVDRAYRTLRTLPGGVAAAFAPRSQNIAVLSAEAGAAVLHFSGDDAPGPLRLTGVPLALTSVPGVGFAVLLGSGSGSGRIVVVDETGRAVGSSDVSETGRDLAYDAASRRFTVIGRGNVVSAALPGGLLAAASAQPLTSPLASVRPSPESPSPSPQVISPSPSSTPSASPSTTAPPAERVAAAAPALPAGVPANAKRISEDLYRVDLGGRTPVHVAATLRRVWFTDTSDGLNAVDMATGAIFTLAQFPRGADIRALAVGATQVYAVDAKSGRLFTFDIASERLSSRDLPILRDTAVLSIGGDGRLWMGTASGQIVSFDPRSSRTEVVTTSMRGIVAIAMDNTSKVWFSDGGRLVGSYDPLTRRVTELIVPGKGAARVLQPGQAGLIWLGTTAGEIIVASDVDATARIVRVTGLPITRLTVDTRGVIWYLTPAPAGSGGYLYGPAASGGRPELIPGPAGSLDFALGNVAWISDVRGGLFVGLGSTR